MFHAKRPHLVWFIPVVGVMLIQAGCQPREVVSIRRIDDSSSAGATAPEEESSDAEGGMEDAAEPPLFAARNWTSAIQLPWEAWYVQYVRGRRAGYFRIDVEQSNILTIRRRKLMEIVTEDQVTRYEVDLVSYENTDGEMEGDGFNEQMESGGRLRRTSSKLTGRDDEGRNELTITLEEDNKTTRKKLVWEDGTWGVLGVQSIFFSQPMSAGERRRANLFLSNTQEIDTVELVAGEWELTTLHGGVTAELLPVEITSIEGSAFATLKAWADKDGTIQKTVTLDGSKISTFRVPGEIGRLLADEYRLASLLDVSISFSGKLPRPDSRSVTYGVQTSSLAMYDFWSNNVRQEVKSRSALNFEITVHDLSEAAARLKIQSESPSTACLGSSDFIQPDDALIEEFAARLLEPQDKPADIVRKLTVGVRDNLQPQPFSAKVLTSEQAARKLAGDCTEHAMLLVALLRCREIPARLASGIQLDTDTRKWNYHMWTEAWLDERWIPLDPMRGDVTSKLCLKMLDSALDTQNPYEVILPVFEKMPSLTISLAD